MPVNVGAVLIGVNEANEKAGTWSADLYLYESWPVTEHFTRQLFDPILRPLLPGTQPQLPWSGLQAAARRIIAAECCAFLVGTGPSLSEERWGPYKAWSSMLELTDAIITFNYDRVLETLIAGSEQIRTMTVADPSVAHLGGPAPVYKLHGSIDWKVDWSTGTPRVNVTGGFASSDLANLRRRRNLHRQPWPTSSR